MGKKIFSNLEFSSSNELVFGIAKYPIRYGFGLEIGNRQVIPELKYFPLANKLKNKESAIKAYKSITENALKHAVNLGIPALQLETEFPEIMITNPDWSADTTHEQISIMEKFHNDYGIKVGYRATIADIRNVIKGGLRNGAFNTLLEAFEQNIESGAHMVSIESFGGKEILSHAVVRGDMEGMIFASGILGTIDVGFLWNEIVNIAGNKAIPAGDTACAHGNSTMVLAGGKQNSQISHVFSAVVRAITGVRSLAAYEQGAIGPGKDCGYENIYMKAITGYPMSTEGKSSACAHSSLVGNIIMAAPDLWSNESVENIRLFSGMAPNAFLEILHYDCSLMNAALKNNSEKEFIKAIVDSNSLNDPQALILTPDSAIRIGKAIISKKEPYHRSINAAKEAIKIIEENQQALNLSRIEKIYLKKIKKTLVNLPDDSNKFIEEKINYYKEKISEFIPENYGL